MKVIFSEFQNNYKTYTFSYAIYAILEKISDLKEIYNAGYLPYTGSKDIQNYFYRCRSLRVNIKNFCLNSENKRIYKKHSNYEIKSFQRFKDIPEKLQAEIFEMYLNYFKNIHGENIMPKDRLQFIFNAVYQNINFIFLKEGKLLGGTIGVKEPKKNFLHIWYIGYNEQLQKSGFGVFMFLEIFNFAKNENYDFVYLGTGYGLKAKYKMNFEGLEYFDGNKWSDSIAELKKMIQNDEENKDFDRIKENKDFF